MPSKGKYESLQIGQQNQCWWVLVVWRNFTESVKFTFFLFFSVYMMYSWAQGSTVAYFQMCRCSLWDRVTLSWAEILRSGTPHFYCTTSVQRIKDVMTRKILLLCLYSFKMLCLCFSYSKILITMHKAQFKNGLDWCFLYWCKSTRWIIYHYHHPGIKPSPWTIKSRPGGLWVRTTYM